MTYVLHSPWTMWFLTRYIILSTVIVLKGIIVVILLRVSCVVQVRAQHYDSVWKWVEIHNILLLVVVIAVWTKVQRGLF
jgi:hypothetical protein